jgi:hypothetical protein
LPVEYRKSTSIGKNLETVFSAVMAKDHALADRVGRQGGFGNDKDVIYHSTAETA